MTISEAAVLRFRRPCGQTHTLPLAQVLMSQKMMHEGRTARGPTECPPMFQAGLLSRESIENLIGAWKGLVAEAARVGAEVDVQPLSTRVEVIEEVLHAR